MNSVNPNPAQARLELALWQADADRHSSSDLFLRLRELGLPPEVAIRLKELLEVVKPIAGKAVSIGKIVVLKLLEFLEKHPMLAIGAALGAALSLLIASIPFLGPILAPVALPLGIVMGAVVGHRVDKSSDSQSSQTRGFADIPQDILEIARNFFALFISTFNAITAEVRA